MSDDAALLGRFRSWAAEADSAFTVRRGQPHHAEANLHTAVIAHTGPASAGHHLGDSGARVLMVRRTASIAPGGAWVLPSTDVVASDWDGVDPQNPLTASRRAAMRALALDHDSAGDETRYVAHSAWLNPPTVPGRSCWWKFLLPGLPDSLVNHESAERRWITPGDALQMHREREIELAPRTWLTLHSLSSPPTAEAKVDFYMLRPARLGDDPIALLPGDSGYATADAELDGPRHRLHLKRSGWVYERAP